VRTTLFALVLAGCATSQQTAMEELQSAVDGYNSAYRWKNFERAASYLPNDMRAAFIAAYEEDDHSLHVETFQILKVDLTEDSATVVVRMRYMELPSITLENRTLTQHWHKVNDVWILETEENSIRAIEVGATPKNPDAVKGVEVPPEKQGDTAIEVSDPEGNVIKKEGEVGGEPK
jgi:hypothetical protein